MVQLQVKDITDFKRTYRTQNQAEFPERLDLSFAREHELRYGENPNQPGAIYCLMGTRARKAIQIDLIKSGKGGISATNYMDASRAAHILRMFPDDPAVAVMKHTIPCGFAKQMDGIPLESQTYEAARDVDARSAFGSVVVFNCPVDQSIAEAITSTYVEGVMAPGFESGAMGVLEKKKDMRVMQVTGMDSIPAFVGDNTQGMYDIKMLPNGRVIVQKPYLSSIRGAEDLVIPMVRRPYKVEGDQVGEEVYAVERQPTAQELDDMLMTWKVNIGVRSNGIVYGKNGVAVSIGSGQQERVGAVEQATIKAIQKAMDREGIKYNPLFGIQGYEQLQENPLEGAAMSSDAFFPFPDSIDTAVSMGVTAFIQPGGSTNDHEVIKAVNYHNGTMVFTLERCFGHF